MSPAQKGFVEGQAVRVKPFEFVGPVVIVRTTDHWRGRTCDRCKRYVSDFPYFARPAYRGKSNRHNTITDSESHFAFCLRCVTPVGLPASAG